MACHFTIPSGWSPMSKINGLDTMTYAQLRELRDRVDAAMVAAQAAEKQELRAKMEAIAAKAGLSIAEILGLKSGANGGKTRGGKIAVKYRNPKDASENRHP